MADQKIIRKTYQASETKAAEGENRRLIVTISTSNPDRSRDVVMPAGMIADSYNRNPVVAAFHRYDQPAIAKTLSLTQTDNSIIAELEFLPKGIYPLADQLYEMYAKGFMNAWSIGFIPKEATDLDPNNFMGGRRFEKWELLEYSAVLVPDNPEALTMLRSKGVSEDVIEQSEHVAPEADAEEVKKQIEQSRHVNWPQIDYDKLEESRKEKSVEDAEIKEGRVLSGANRKAIADTVSQMKSAIESMEKLLDATQTAPSDEKTAEPTPNPIVDASLKASLVLIDQTTGKALRLINEQAKKDN